MFQIITFYPGINYDELNWHNYFQDKCFILLSETDWQFQIYTKLPIPFSKTTIVRRNIDYRFIPGELPLVLKINNNKF